MTSLALSTFCYNRVRSGVRRYVNVILWRHKNDATTFTWQLHIVYFRISAKRTFVYKSVNISAQGTRNSSSEWKSHINNVTTVIEVRSASFGLVLHAHHIFANSLLTGTWRALVSVITTLYCVALIFVIECGIARFLCAMCVFEVWASSSSTRLLLCQISFLSRPPLLR